MIRLFDLGMIAFDDALRVQEEAVAEIAAGGEERLLLLEHPPVYTIGSGGQIGNLIDPAVTAVRVNRGGDVTFHGPGQLVGYPLLDLSRRGRDLHLYLRCLEAFLVEISTCFGVAAHTVAGRTGVWSAGGKLASVGVGVRRWVTMHGFALNVANDLAPFRLINPCGIIDCPLTSLSLERGRGATVSQVKQEVGARFEGAVSERLALRDVSW
jgi:lipoyl(octanoyl) transferase